jgi:hypothetical protein
VNIEEVPQHLSEILALVQQAFTPRSACDDLLGRLTVTLHRGPVLLPSMLDLGLPQHVNHGPASPRPVENIPALIAGIREELSTMADAIGAADGTRKAELLSNRGVLVSYDPLTRRALVTCRPKGK